MQIVKNIYLRICKLNIFKLFIMFKMLILKINLIINGFTIFFVLVYRLKL